jgi:hypothetical protein
MVTNRGKFRILRPTEVIETHHSPVVVWS